MDERTIHEFGIDGFTLMEVAGNKAADFIHSKFPDGGHGIILCGKGNNAGDALVVARVLAQYQFQLTLIFVEGTENLSPDASRNFDLLCKLDSPITIHSTFDPSSLHFACDFIVDGLLGTGLSSNLREVYADAVDWINQQTAPTCALDIPSGLHGDTGEVMGVAVTADYTLTFGAYKPGFFLNNGPTHSREIILCDLPFPNHLKDVSHFLMDEQWVKRYKSGKTRKHKYADGMLYIVAGSEGLTGAAILAAQSAWASGIGAVTLITPKGLLDIYEKNLVEIIKKPVGNSADVSFALSHLKDVQAILQEKPGVLLIGPGLGRNKDTIAFTRQLLATYEGNAVIDADALFALAQLPVIQKPAPSNWILTPHPGELAALTNSTISSDQERISKASIMAGNLSATIVSKGSPTVIGTPDGNRYITGYQTNIFSRAGFGDVLAGKIAARSLIDEHTTLAICSALLDGKKKADTFIEKNDGDYLAPLDIL